MQHWWGFKINAMILQYKVAIGAKHNEMSKAGIGKSVRSAHLYSAKEASECEAQD